MRIRSRYSTPRNATEEVNVNVRAGDLSSPASFGSSSPDWMVEPTSKDASRRDKENQVASLFLRCGQDRSKQSFGTVIQTQADLTLLNEGQVLTESIDVSNLDEASSGAQGDWCTRQPIGATPAAPTRRRITFTRAQTSKVRGSRDVAAPVKDAALSKISDETVSGDSRGSDRGDELKSDTDLASCNSPLSPCTQSFISGSVPFVSQRCILPPRKEKPVCKSK